MSPPRSSSGRHPLLIALGLALLIKALVPTGWMPAFAADGALRIAPCGSWAPTPALAPAPAASAPAPAADHHAGGHHGASGHHAAPDDTGASNGGSDHHGDNAPADQPCAFAGGSLAWTLFSAPPTKTAPPAAPSPALPPVRHTAPGRGLAAPPPPSTGPPLTA